MRDPIEMALDSWQGSRTDPRNAILSLAGEMMIIIW